MDAHKYVLQLQLQGAFFIYTSRNEYNETNTINVITNTIINHCRRMEVIARSADRETS